MKKVIPADSILVPEQAKKVFEGMIFDVYQWQQEMFDGSDHTFEMLKRTDTVNAICIVDGKILVINDVQPHMGSRQSFPGGRVDDTDTDIVSAAKREILEETGYKFRNWRLIKVTQPYRKIEWFVYTFVAWDEESRHVPKLDPGEKITVQALPFEEVAQKVASNVGYLGESQPVFKAAQDLEALLALPEFTGEMVDR